MDVTVGLPAVLAGLAGATTLAVAVPDGGTLTDLLDVVRADHPAVERRIRDETGALRRFVNVYVDGDDVRVLAGVATALRPHSEVLVVPSVAGG
jgi:molybdopterin synthase sulfur carrier subunit